ncbi:phenylalanyl-tRNA synthetase subunit beta [Pontivivens ytuae]|uniref:Phenylalanyl-tRNA synthetase subunit beta n=1 Tax=Pontivivens ytuae TaxID=2789856 RepID=A0A7S9LPZ0_9RHOB|nr:phenylalanyl-tRNA synthetase subunit beta [Pontivivens ytuae]QPH52810.1 phenylalanyl-tRNA synthetase subunit beta [Pontivivens ytuae]
MSSLRRLWFIVLALMVVGGHIAMLTSDRMPFDVALRLTLVNAAIWAVLLLPLLLFALLRR